MLVLTIDEHGEAWIGRDAEIRVRVLRIEHGRVRLGFVAPPDVPVNRASVAAWQQRYYGRILVPAEAVVMLKERGRNDGP